MRNESENFERISCSINEFIESIEIYTSDWIFDLDYMAPINSLPYTSTMLFHVSRYKNFQKKTTNCKANHVDIV